MLLFPKVLSTPRMTCSSKWCIPALPAFSFCTFLNPKQVRWSESFQQEFQLLDLQFHQDQKKVHQCGCPLSFSLSLSRALICLKAKGRSRVVLDWCSQRRMCKTHICQTYARVWPISVCRVCPFPKNQCKRSWPLREVRKLHLHTMI